MNSENKRRHGDKSKKIDYKGKKRGPETYLDQELTTKIRALVLFGKNYKTIQKELDIPEGTWDHWVRVNYQGFAEKLHTYQHDYMLSIAEKNIHEAMTMEVIEPVIGMFGPVIDKETKQPVMKPNDKLVKIKVDASTFVAETLGKKSYSKKIEVEDKTPKKLIVLKESQQNGSITYPQFPQPGTGSN